MTRCLVLSLVSLATLSAGSVAWADDAHDHGFRRDPHNQIDRRSAELAQHSRELYDEIREHYRGQPFAAHLMSDSLNVYRSARRMTGYAQAHSRYSTMEREVQRLEDAFHHLEDTLRGVRQHHGSHRHIRDLARHMDDLVHQIHDDVHDLRHEHVGHGGGYGYGSGYGYGNGWTFGSGGFTVRLGR